MDRREFLKSGFAAGGLVAASSLPLRAEDDPALFPSRGVFERLELSYQHIHIDVQDRFSPTAMQYVVGGNFMYHGEEILFT